MKPAHTIISYTLACVIGGPFLAGPAAADKGGRKERAEQQDERRSEAGDERRGGDEMRYERRGGDARREHFDDRHRVAVREFYEREYGGKRCPPGLAKKHNGCLPPGQARKWQLGQPLPREVMYYEVPQPLVIQIGIPPSGYRYVRVASDILMIAIGTGMVVDAIKDLGR